MNILGHVNLAIDSKIEVPLKELSYDKISQSLDDYTPTCASMPPQVRCFEDIVKYEIENALYKMYIFGRTERNFALNWKNLTFGKIKGKRVKLTDGGAVMSTDTDMIVIDEVIKKRGADADYMNYLIEQDDREAFKDLFLVVSRAMCNVDVSIGHLLHLGDMKQWQKPLIHNAVEAHMMRGFLKRIEWFMDDVCNFIADKQIAVKKGDLKKLREANRLFDELTNDPDVAIELSTFDLNRPFSTGFKILRNGEGLPTVLVADRFRIKKGYIDVMQEDTNVAMEGLDSFFDTGGDLLKYLYSVYNEIFHYTKSKKDMARAEGKTVMTQTEYEDSRKDADPNQEIYIDKQPVFEVDKDDFDPIVAQANHQRCVAYAAIAEKFQLSKLIKIITVAVRDKKESLRSW